MSRFSAAVTLTATFFAAAVGLAFDARAADKNDCAESAVACMGRRYEAANNELNAVYQKLLEKLDDQAKELLKTSERAWLNFRDANGALRAGDWRGGFAGSPVKFAALADMTRERTKLLRQMSNRMADFPWEEKACRKSGQTTMEMQHCIDLAFQAADRELNVAYQAAMAKLDAEGKEFLKKAQRAWIAYRDAEPALYADFWRGGTEAGAAAAAARTGLTRRRTQELRDVAKENE